MKKAVHTICIFLSLAFAFVAVTFCWFSRGEFHFFNTSDYAQLLCAGENAA